MQGLGRVTQQVSSGRIQTQVGLTPGPALSTDPTQVPTVSLDSAQPLTSPSFPSKPTHSVLYFRFCPDLESHGVPI